MAGVAVEASIVGREGELGAITQALTELECGGSSCLAITGEPGIGKTRLCRELVRRASERDLLTISGSAAEIEHDVPYGPFVDALGPLLSRLSSDRLDSLRPGLVDELVPIFPDLAWRGTVSRQAQNTARHGGHNAVCVLLEALAGADRGLVLVLDDLHWADEASIELVAHLLRRRLAVPAVLVLSFRTVDAPPRLLRAVAGATSGGVRELELAPLAEVEAEAMLVGLDSASRESVYRDSGGNPFYLQELIRAGAGRRAMHGAPSGRLEAEVEPFVPRPVRWAIADELTSLPAAARRLLWAAAVVGDPFDLESAAAVAGLSADAGLGALDVLLARDLLRAGDRPRRFHFRHPIVRRAVYDWAGPARRLEAHARAAAELERDGAPVGLRAHHVANSAMQGDEAAIDLLARAGHEAAGRAPAASARWFQAALSLLPAKADQSRRISLLVPLAIALGTSGHPAESRAALVDALELLPSELTDRRAGILVLLARAEHMLGRHGVARKVLTDAVRDVTPRSAAALQLELAIDHWHASEWEAMSERAQAAACGGKGDRPGLHAEAVALLGLAEHGRGRLPAAAVNAEHAQQMVCQLSDRELAQRIESCVVLCYLLYVLERHRSAAELARRALRIARETGQRYFYVPLETGLGLLSLWRGRLAAAEVHSETAVDAALRLGDDQLLTWALAVRCWTLLLRGDLVGAQAVGRESAQVVARCPTALFAPVSQALYGRVLCELGDPAAGRDHMLAWGGGPELPRIDGPFDVNCYCALVDAELALGRQRAASLWGARADAAAACRGLPGREGLALRARATVLLAPDCSPDRKRAAEAAALALEASRLLSISGQVLEVARAQTLAGRALAVAGDHQDAVDQLQRAHATFTRCGAERYVDQCAQLLRGLGKRVQHGGRRTLGDTGLTVLSARETEIAELVARGLTNRQIGAELFVTEKTVESHMSNIFGKLGASSRATVAALVAGSRVVS